MNAIVQFVVKHGYSILFAAMFAHQIGLPIPGPLFLLAAGALAASGKLSLLGSLALAVSAAVMADWLWYEAGRRKGDKVLHFIHRLTRDPDAHDRRAKKTFSRYGPSLLVIAKFVPGLDAVVPPLAGTSGTSRLRFLAFETVGVSLYACVYLGLGHIFSHDLDRAAAYVGRAGKLLAGVALAGLLIYACTRKLLRWNCVRRALKGGRHAPAHPMQSASCIANSNMISKESNLTTDIAPKPQALPVISKSLLLTITFALLAFSPICRAQTQEPNIDSAIEVARAGMRADRTTIITSAMNFSDKDGAAFWPIYRQYEHERSRLDDGRVAVIKEYTQKYPNLTDAEADSMANQMLDCESRLAVLKKKYYKKFNKVLPGVTVAKFFQLDRRVDLLMDMNVEASLPPLTLAQPASGGTSE